MSNTTVSCPPTRRRRHKQQLHVKTTIINSSPSNHVFDETSSSPDNSNKGLLSASSQCYDYQDEKENTNIQSKGSCLPKATTCKSIKPKLSFSSNRSSSLNDNGYKVSTSNTSKSHSHSSQSTHDLLAEASTNTTQNPISCKTLLSIIAQASITFPNTVTNGEGSILLENKKVELVNVARRCLKESFKDEYKNNYQIKIANLRIAIHSLRAITPLLFSKHDTTNIRQDLLRMNIQLIYHCITTCEKLQTDIFTSTTTMTTKVDSKEERMIMIDSFLSLTLMSLAAYQTLGMLLYDKLLLSVNERSTTIRTIFDFFPIPKYMSDLDNDHIGLEEKQLGDILSSNELMKICVESTYSVCIVVKNFLYHTMNKLFGKEGRPSRMISFFMEERNSLRDEFGVAFANVVKESLFKQSQDDLGGSYLFPSFSSFQQISMSTLLSWSLSPSPDSDDNYTSTKLYDVVTLISTVKRVQKVTSDIITHLDEMVSTCQSGPLQNDDSGDLDHIQCTYLDSLLEEGIYLRQDLVMSLLLYYRNIKGEWVSLLPSAIRSKTCIDDSVLKMYQRACKLGWQYPASLRKTLRQNRLIELLHESFYIQFGSALDEVAIYFEEDGTSYIEYCAHRAMQLRDQCTLQSMSTKKRCEQSDCLFNCLPFKFVHSRRYCCGRCKYSENNKRSTALCLFFFSLYFKGYSSQQDDVELLCQMKSKGDEMISIFQDCYISNDSITYKCEDNDLEYVFNLLSYLRLIGWATDVVKSKIRNVSEFISIYFLSQVLGHVFSPLCSASVSRIKGSNNKFCNLTIESCIRSASVLNYLSMASYGDQCGIDLSKVQLKSPLIDQSDQLLINCHLFCRELSTKQISTLHSTIENAAKLLSIIGKQRIEQSNTNSSLIPLILSIDLFSILQKTCKSNHQISARYHYLASLMLSQHMTAEASVALLFSIKYTFLESVKQGSDEVDDLLSEITSLCMIFTQPRSNSLATRDYGETQSATTKLVSIILDMFQSPNAGDEKMMIKESICASIQISNCIDYLQCVSRIVDSDRNFLLANLVQNTLLSDETSSGFLRKDRLYVIRNLIHCMGASISGIMNDKDTKKIVENNLDMIVSSTESYFKQAEVSHLDLLVQLYSTAAISFGHMIENFKSCDCLDVALRYVEMGLKENPKNLLLLVYKVSLIYSHFCSSDRNTPMNQNTLVNQFFLPRWNKSKYDNLLSLCASIVDLIFQQQDGLGETYAVRKVLNILSYILCFVYNDLDVEGSSVVAAKYSLILLKRIISGSELMATNTMLQGELYHDVEVLFDTASALKKSRLLSIMNEISSIIENRRNAEFTSRQGLDNFLGHLSVNIWDLSIQLAMFVKASDYSTLLEFLPFFSNYMSNCKAIREKINNDENMPSILLVLIEYWILSCYKGMGDCLFQIGDPLKALSWYRLSIVHCKFALECMKNKSIFPRPDCAHPLCNYYSLPGVYLSRLKQLFMKMGVLYSQLGDYRKSSSYAISLMETVGFIGKGHFLAKRTSYSDVLRDLSICVSTPSLMVYRRFMLRTLSKCRSPVWCKEGFVFVLNELENKSQKNLIDSHQICSENLDYYREIVKDFLLFGDTFQGFKLLYDHYGNIFPLKEMSTLTHTINNLPLSRSVYFINKSVKHYGVGTFDSDDKTRLTDTICEVAMKLANMLLLGEDQNNQYQATQILKTIESMPYVPRAIRLQVLYDLGLIALKIARKNGELIDLWSGNSDIYQSFESLDSAYTYFYDAALIAGPSSLLTSRKVLRCLALVTGPEFKRCNRKIPAGELVHTSIGGSARIQASLIANSTKNFADDSIGDYDEQTHSLFDAFDLPLHASQRCVELEKLYQLSDKIIPHSWKLSAFALCPTGELLISSFNHKAVKNPYRTVCVFPSETTTNVPSEFSESILTPFDNLIERSRKQLKGLDNEAKEAYNKDSNARKKWWDERLDIDQHLEEILIKLNDFCFSSAQIKELLFGCSQATPSPNYDDIQDLDAENLAARFEAACSFESVSKTQSTATRESLNQVTVAKLKERLGSLGVTSKEMRGLKKSELIDLLISNENDSGYQSESQSSCNTNNSEDDEKDEDCLFIILDEQISRLPFEGTSTLKNKTVCRIPSIAFALSSIIRSNSDSSKMSINPSLASYVLDPESNLQNSRERLQPKFDQLSEINSWDWKKVVGATPSEEFMKEALLKPKGLFIFCGHGGGERFFSRYQIEKLKSESAFEQKVKDKYKFSLPCQSSVILMGCSSGKLTSVNECVGQSSSNIDMHFEPEGASLSYLCAGAPCVVGNLWDVTDRDIDKFFLTFLDLFMGTSSIHSTKNLPKCLAESRDVCKMKHIVGCAPVVYGIPLYLLRN